MRLGTRAFYAGPAEAWSHAFGVDISAWIVWGARQTFERDGLILRGVLSDVRALPFQPDSP